MSRTDRAVLEVLVQGHTLQLGGYHGHLGQLAAAARRDCWLARWLWAGSVGWLRLQHALLARVCAGAGWTATRQAAAALALAMHLSWQKLSVRHTKPQHGAQHGGFVARRLGAQTWAKTVKAGSPGEQLSESQCVLMRWTQGADQSVCVAGIRQHLLCAAADRMGHHDVWNSHPDKFSKGGRQW